MKHEPYSGVRELLEEYDAWMGWTDDDHIPRHYLAAMEAANRQRSEALQRAETRWRRMIATEFCRVSGNSADRIELVMGDIGAPCVPLGGSDVAFVRRIARDNA